MTHTPGPWVSTCADEFISGPSGQAVAKVYGMWRSDRAANAALIAQAPTLLAERDEAREHRRRLFEALEGRLEDAPEWTPQFARELLDDLRPHVKKEGA